MVQGRREAEAKRVADEIVATGGKAAIAVGDLATDAGAEAVVEATLSAISGIDILVNNAGIAPVGDWFQTNADTWMEIYNLNVAGLIRLINRFAPTMKEQGWGASFPLPVVKPANPRSFKVLTRHQKLLW